MKRLAVLLLIPFAACTPKSKPLSAHINLTPNHQSIEFSGLDAAIIGELTRDSANWQSLIPVYRMPEDTDLKSYQPVQSGMYSVKDSIIVFTPDTPFVKGQTYFMRYYQFAKDNDIKAFITERNRLNNIKYTDLIFKR